MGSLTIYPITGEKHMVAPFSDVMEAIPNRTVICACLAWVWYCRFPTEDRGRCSSSRRVNFFFAANGQGRRWWIAIAQVADLFGPRRHTGFTACPSRPSFQVHAN